MTTHVTIVRPSNWHAHLRAGQMMEAIARHTVRHYHWVLVMPNLKGAEIITGSHALRHWGEISGVTLGLPAHYWMTLYLTPDTTPADLEQAHTLLNGKISVKLYPAGEGGTTNSARGLRFLEQGYECFATMQKLGMVLNVHAEVPDGEPGAEQRFLPQLAKLVEDFPDLPIVVEHVSTAEGVAFIKGADGPVAGSITPQHLILTADDLEHNVHNRCLPPAQSALDRDALILAATTSSPKFFMGDDSAPHLPEDKQAGSHGVFSGPVTIPVLAGVFEEHAGPAWAAHLQNFASYNGCDFYKVDRPNDDDVITLVREPWVVPDLIGGVVPFMSGQRLDWQVQDAYSR